MNDYLPLGTHASPTHDVSETQRIETDFRNTTEFAERVSNIPKGLNWYCYIRALEAAEFSDDPGSTKCFYCPDTSCSRKSMASASVSLPTEGYD